MSGLAWTQALSPAEYVARHDRLIDHAVQVDRTRVNGLYRCTNGHRRCSLDAEGRCYQDELQLVLADRCETCGGSGDSPERDAYFEPCPDCGGTGRKEADAARDVIAKATGGES